MATRFLLLHGSTLLLLVLTGSGCGEPRSARPSPPKLAVEFEEQFEPAGRASISHLNIGNGSSSSTEYPFRSLRPLAGAITPSRDGSLDLEFTVDADKAVTAVYAIPPESDPQRYSEGHKRLLGTHSARLNESVTLDELTKIGYTPFTIHVVKPKSAPTAHPALNTKVSSIQIAIAGDDTLRQPDIDGETPSCRVKLHNLSSRGVVAYVLGGGEGTIESFDSYGKAVIDPGKDSRAQLFSFGRATQMTPQGPVDLPPKPQRIVVKAVLFTDGSAEGEPSVAARLKGRQIENLRFYRVITPAVDRIVGDSSLNDDQRVAHIKDEIYRIPSAPDQAAIHSLHAKFPDVDAAALAAGLNQSSDAAKNEFWGDLYGYVNKCCQSPPPDHISVAVWWRRKRSKLEPLLNSSN